MHEIANLTGMSSANAQRIIVTNRLGCPPTIPTRTGSHQGHARPSARQYRSEAAIVGSGTVEPEASAAAICPD